MNKKLIFISSLFTIIFSLFFSYGLVFSSGSSLFNDGASMNFSLTNVIYSDSKDLNKTKILFKSSKNLNNAKIESKCSTSSRITNSKGNFYLFELNFLPGKCDNSELILVDEKGEMEYRFSLKILPEFEILSKLLDQKTSKLVVLEKALLKKISNYSKYEKYSPEIEKNYYIYLKNNRILREAFYNKNLISDIIEKRGERYIVPILGFKLSTKSSKIPNAGRPYRALYTDGIHRGWDVDTKYGGENVVALDDGIIIRVVSGFKYSDLDRIKYGDHLTDIEKARNLDTLRGNQVWLKTMKGDVILYSHLTDVFTNIKVGQVVKRGQPLGTDGITGVPDKNYSDFHLHFTVLKNPFKNTFKGYELEDYLLWNWEFKGKSEKYILENQNKIFE